MTTARLWRSLMWTGVVCCAATMMVACDKPTVGQAGQPVASGGMEFSVGDYDVRYLQLSAHGETYEYPRPVLVIPVTITNKGPDARPYAPTHDAAQMSEASTPLLYADPGPEAKLPPESKSPISGAVIKKGELEGQIKEPTTIEPNASITDLFVFQVPPQGINSLILSLPPTLHRAKMPVLVRIPYTPKEPKGPKVYAQGDAAKFKAATLTVTGNDVAYIEIDDTTQGKGFSTEPLLKVTYTIKNDGQAALTYEPNHKVVSGGVGAKLFSDEEGAYNRATFAATTTAKNQRVGKTSIKPGTSIEDYVLFERPGEDVKSLTFEMPASLFNQEGIARFSLPYTYKSPELPKELQKKEAAPPAEAQPKP